jgi:hypothetical protein
MMPPKKTPRSPSKSQAAQAVPGRRPRYEWLMLAGLVAASLLLHGMSIIEGFGEPDTARYGVLAEEWHTTGKIHSYSYHLRTSPLYLHGLKLLLDAGLPLTAVPAVLNWLNLIVGSLLLIPLYLLWRDLIHSTAAFLGCVLFSVTPAFWLANIYGAPHLPAFASFVTSLWLLAGWARRGGGLASGRLIGVMGLAVLTVLLKADLILCFGAYLGLLWCLGALGRRNVAWSLALPVVCLVAVVLYARLITADIPALTASAGEWENTFPFTLEALTDKYNRMVPVRSVGIMLCAGAAVSLVVCLIRRRHLKLLLFVMFWALPLLLFWSLKMGNSARHMMAAFCPLMFVTAVTALDTMERPLLRWPVVLAVLIVNYFLTYDGGTISPTANLVRLNQIAKNFAYVRHTFARAFADLVDVDNKLYAGITTIAYVEYEAFVRADSYQILNVDPRIYRVVNDGEKAQIFRIRKLSGTTTIGPSENYLLFSFEPSIIIRQHTKWKPYLSDEKFKDIFEVMENEPD